MGNACVILAVLLERHLQSVANYLVLSLAVADLLVACLVMPLGAVYQINERWVLGPTLCDMWTSSDVLCCTASILHLVAIATDRYWAVTRVEYIHSRTTKRIGIMILLVWSLAVLVSFAPLFGWKDSDYLERVNVQEKCLVSQDIAYQVVATCATFYVPLAVILVLYWQIFKIARLRIRRKTGAQKIKKKFDCVQISEGHSDAHPTNDANSGNKAEIVETALDTTNQSEKETSTGNLKIENDHLTQSLVKVDNGNVKSVETISRPRKKQKERKETIEAKRERKAAKTLAIVTGAFVVCWLPFFVCAILMPLCTECVMNDSMLSFFLWLGYFNSTLNPIIYTIFSPEFRQAFTRLLLGKRATRNKNRQRRLR
ncbi:5-hydroxytryptamine receptor 2A-like isoform X2 [Artemia franciscana]|uniref:5-hydroxytryptamine receptor 2A-like isoform X2 n=1 Tax=Artemia franciscana TaxID=6661 RepID=UPI0032DBDB62